MSAQFKSFLSGPIHKAADSNTKVSVSETVCNVNVTLNIHQYTGA